MPIMPCSKDGRPGFKYGKNGKCYPYNKGDEKSMANAKKRASDQGRAIEASKHS
jgi:hypothetical protein